MTRPALTRARLLALCAAAFLLVPLATAEAQQALVPARPMAAPDWFESNRTLQILRAQQQGIRPVGRGSGLASGEAEQIYQNYMQQIGKPIRRNSRSSGFGPSGGFGSLSSGYGSQQ